MNKWIEEHADQQLALLKTLAAIPAPSHIEDRRVMFLLNWLENIGIENAYADEAKNVIVPFAAPDAEGITIYTAHTDVVFPDVTPLPVVQDGDILRAPGVGDDTANVVGILMLLRYIKENKLTPKDPVIFVLNSCEEGLGNLKGIRQIMKDFGARTKEHVSFDGPYNFGIVTQAVGSERWRVTAKTVGGHSYAAFGNPNAIVELSRLIMKLNGQDVPKKEGVHTTFNVGTISGGTSVNTIAQNAEMLYEYRSNDREHLAQMRRQFEEALESVKSERAEFSVECVGERPCGGEIDGEALARLHARAEEAVREAVGPEGVILKRPGSTDSNIPLSMGIPSVTFGLYVGGGEHTREEWLEIPSLTRGLAIAFKMVLPHFE